MAIPLIELVDAARLRRIASDSALTNGEQYAREGRVNTLEQTKDRVRALVLGGAEYQVELRAVGGRLLARCDCPMGARGVFCKHCVATALHGAAVVGTKEPEAGESVPSPQTTSTAQWKHEAEVEDFLERHGLQHLHGMGAEALLPFLDERDRTSVRYVLSRQRLTDFASVEAIRRRGQALSYAPRLRSLLPEAAWRCLHAAAEEVARARTEVPARLELPEDEATHPLFRLALEARALHPPSLAPQPASALLPDLLHFSEALPGFTWSDPRPFSPAADALPRRYAVELRVLADRVQTTCTCEGAPCVHSLSALDALLLRLQGPASELRTEQLADLLRPAWERALRAIDRACEPSERAEGQVVVSWRLSVAERDGILVQPYLHRLTRKGLPGSGARISPSRLLDLHGPQLSAEDRPVAALAARTTGYARRPLLEALIGHPRVFQEGRTDAPLAIERARVGLLADHRGESVVLVPALDGAALPGVWVQRLRRGDEAERPLFFFEESARRLTLLEVPELVRRTLDALDAFGNDFPQESHAALVEKLSALSSRIPVALPRSVMGEEVPIDYRTVVRIQVQADGGVRVELRVRPLPESATFLPGEGARDVHVRRGTRALHTRRDVEAEHALAEALADRVGLDRRGAAGETPFCWVLPGAQAALVLLAALEALAEDAPQLEWVGQPLRLVGQASPSDLRVTLERKRDWFGVSGGLSVAGERVTLAVVLDAARRRQRFVQVADQTWLEVGEALRNHLQKLSDHTWTARHGVEVGPSAAHAVQALEELGAKIDADRAWTDLAARIFAAGALSPRVPGSLKATLRDYQLEGFRWLSRLAAWGAGAVLADDMGLGKTVQALAVLLDRAKLGPALVVAPTSVGFNWVDEARRFAPSLKVRVFAESTDRGATLQALRPREVLIVSYGLLARDAERLSQVRFSTVVFDEAQAMKNAHTQRARAARMLQGDFKFALSGTPLENHLGELWSLYRTVFPGLLGSWDAFRDRFATPIEKHIDPTARPALSRVLQPFLLRRTKDQVARELPPRTDLRVPVVLSAEEWQLYEDARLAALSELETPRRTLKEQQRRIEVLAALTRLRLLASHPRLYDPRSTLQSAKLRRLLELVEELRDEGHRALVFSQFTSHLALVREALDARGIRYLYLDGRTSRAEREARVRTFQEGSHTLFLISLKAGGFGLNLTAADNVIHLDPWWNPAVEDQASDRAHRIGQQRPVTVYRLVAKGTIEEQILAMHEEKRDLVTSVLDGTDEAARLSTSALLDLLSQPAARAFEALDPGTTERH